METTMKRRRLLRTKIRRRNNDSNSSSSSSNGTDNGACFRNWSDLILVHIFSRLPVNSLTRFKCVSKHWRSIITHDKCLIKLHNTHGPTTVTSFLVSPTFSRMGFKTPPCPFRGIVEIRSIMFSPEDLRFDGGEGGSSSHSDGVALFRNHNNLILNARYNVLPPAGGLVCFVNCDEDDSFLIYNPCTGEKTRWIKASASELFVSDFGQQQVAASPENFRLKHGYMFAFGYDPITRQHKVLCLYVITVLKRRDRGDRYSPVIDSRKVMCGVLTVGDNKWRAIDRHQVPVRITGNKRYVHINGCLCWIYYRPLMNSEVVVFDVGREIFRVIAIPNSIPKLYASCNTGKLVDELVEVDGNLAVLFHEKDDKLHMWNYVGNNDNDDGNWTKDTILMPYRWDELVNLDFKPIAGTKLAVVKFNKFIQQQQHECLLYYNMEEKKYYRNRHESLFHTYAWNARYQITPFFETLLPVQTTRDVRKSTDIYAPATSMSNGTGFIPVAAADEEQAEALGALDSILLTKDTVGRCSRVK